MLAVLTLVVFGCAFASAQTFVGGFGTAGGYYLYCNYEILQNAFGAPYAVWQGSDILTTCGLSYNATVAGIKGGLSAAGNPAGFAVTGVTYADNIYDAEGLSYTGAQWDVTSALKCVKKNKKTGKYGPKYGWIGFAGLSGTVFGDNYGYLTCDIPGKTEAPVKAGMSIGSAKAPARK